MLDRARRARNSLEQELLKHSDSSEASESRELPRVSKVLARSDGFEETDSDGSEAVFLQQDPQRHQQVDQESPEIQSSLPVKRKTVRYIKNSNQR